MSGILDSVNLRTQMVGQNRMELLLFGLETDQRFGINVFKVREVLQCPDLTEVPRQTSAIKGMAHIRGETIPVLDLSEAVGRDPVPKEERVRCFLIVVEYNRRILAFLVRRVDRILNTQWDQINAPPAEIGVENYLTAILEYEGKLIEIIDVEQILADLYPTSTEVSHEVADAGVRKQAEQHQVLIVDDSSVARNQMRRSLEGLGLKVTSANNGRIAWGLLEGLLSKGMDPNEVFLMVISDIEMPEMDGYGVVYALNKNEKTANIPSVFLTAKADKTDLRKGMELGADDYLTKPYSPRELLARVERSLRSKVASDDMRATQELLREQQQVIKHTFSRFVAGSVVDELLKDPSRIKLGGQLQAVTVLFADLQGFTSLSEDTEPQNLLQLLNSYHTFMVDFILKYGGTVDKFLGDGLMALYNTPIQQDDHIARAVKTALHIQDDLYWFTQELPEEHRLKINFGIHTGDAIVGNVGSDNLMDFTAVGDTVNVAARLQGVADEGEILVSVPVFEATQDFVFGRTRGHLTVKGRKETVDAYQISNTYFE